MGLITTIQNKTEQARAKERIRPLLESRMMRDILLEIGQRGTEKLDPQSVPLDQRPLASKRAAECGTAGLQQSVIREIVLDASVYQQRSVTIIEIMGRHAGWLTAAAALAGVKGDGPDLIYLPEVDFHMDSFLADVKRVYEEKKNCIVAVSEGIHYADGTFVSEAKTSGTDGFGHAQLGGLAARLADVVKAATGAKVRPIELSLLQRCAAHCASGTDIAESFLSGKTAVEAAVAGETDKMVGFACTRDEDGYRCEPKLFDLSLVANTEKKVPTEWINAQGNQVTQAFIDYCLPLIQGETGMIKEDGLPRFCHLKRVFAK